MQLNDIIYPEEVVIRTKITFAEMFLNAFSKDRTDIIRHRWIISAKMTETRNEWDSRGGLLFIIIQEMR